MDNFNPKLASDWYKLIELDSKHAATMAASWCRKLSAATPSGLRDEALAKSCGGEWTVRRGEGMRRVYCLFDGTERLLMEGKKVRLGELESLKMRHNAALRDYRRRRARKTGKQD